MKGGYIVISYNHDDPLILPKRNNLILSIEKLLGISFPFYIHASELDSINLISRLYVKYHAKATFRSPCCGIERCKVHSTTPHVFQTLDILGYKNFVHEDVPKIKCSRCGIINTLPLSWPKEGTF
jgi:transposase